MKKVLRLCMMLIALFTCSSIFADAVVFNGEEDTANGFTSGNVTVGFISDTYAFKEDSETASDKTSFVGYWTGSNNPKDGKTAYTVANKTLPTAGSVMTLTPSKSGTLTAYIVVNKDKAIYVVGVPANSTTYDDVNFEINGTSYTAGDGNKLAEKVSAASLSFDAKAGETYYVFCTGSKMGFYGYQLAEASAKTKWNTPEITIGSWDSTNKVYSVTISGETGATISYKIGSGDYQTYSSAVSVPASTTISAKATGTGYSESEVTSVTTEGDPDDVGSIVSVSGTTTTWDFTAITEAQGAKTGWTQNSEKKFFSNPAFDASTYLTPSWCSGIGIGSNGSAGADKTRVYYNGQGICFNGAVGSITVTIPEGANTLEIYYKQTDNKGLKSNTSGVTLTAIDGGFKVEGLNAGDAIELCRNSGATYITKVIAKYEAPAVAQQTLEYKQNGSLTFAYDATASREVYEFGGIYKNQVYGTATKEIKAGKPYIVTAGDDLVLSYTEANEVTTGSGYNGFYGVLGSAATVTGDSYMVFYDGNLYYASEEGTEIPVGRAYFLNSEIPSGKPTGTAKALFGFNLEDYSTGINTVTAALKSNTPVYNISGQRVNSVKQGGVYLVNGKKVVVK